MNALEYHIIFAVSFAFCLLMASFNQVRMIKNLETGNPFKRFAVTAVFGVLSTIFAFASISALLIHLFGK